MFWWDDWSGGRLPYTGQMIVPVEKLALAIVLQTEKKKKQATEGEAHLCEVVVLMRTGKGKKKP